MSVVTVKQFLAVDPTPLADPQQLPLGLPKCLLLAIQLLNQLRHTIWVQMKGAHLAGEVCYKCLQTHAAGFGKIGAARKGCASLSAKRSDILRKRTKPPKTGR